MNSEFEISYRAIIEREVSSKKYLLAFRGNLYDDVSCEGTTPHLLQSSAGVGTHAVQLVDEGEERDVVALHLPVHCHGLTLDPSHRTQNQYGPVQHTQSSLHFDGEVHVTCATIENIRTTNPLQIIMLCLLLVKNRLKEQTI